MKWSFKLGTWWGIDVYVHLTFLLLLAWVGIGDAAKTRSLTQGLGGALLYASLFACVLLHEYGHAMAARHYGIPTRDITLLPIGGVARLERLPDNPRHELVIAIAGPLVNVVLAAALSAFMLLAHGTLLPRETGGGIFVIQQLLTVNVSLVLFNLLPAFPMDGGRILRAVMSMMMDPVRATRIAAGVGRVMAVVFAGIALRYEMYILLLIAVFVWIGAGGEAQAAEARAAVRNAVVGQAMSNRFQAVSADDSLGRIGPLVAGSVQQGFPVLDGERVVGLLTRSDLIRALERGGGGESVEHAMRSDFVLLQADEPLEPAVTRLAGSGLPSAPVVWLGRLVGLLDLGAGPFGPGRIPPAMPMGTGTANRAFQD